LKIVAKAILATSSQSVSYPEVSKATKYFWPFKVYRPVQQKVKKKTTIFHGQTDRHIRTFYAHIVQYAILLMGLARIEFE
jgi:hypothetical protein